jgi:hypothetical protein
MTMIAEYDWQSDAFTHPTDRAAWRAAVAEIAAKAHAKCGLSHIVGSCPLLVMFEAFQYIKVFS